MLTVDQRSAVYRFAGLEDFPIAALADSRGVEAEHRGERQPAARRIAAHHSHPPIRHDQLVAAARPALVIEIREHDAIMHELPTAVRGHIHVHLFVLTCGVHRLIRRLITRCLRACTSGQEQQHN